MRRILNNDGRQADESIERVREMAKAAPRSIMVDGAWRATWFRSGYSVVVLFQRQKETEVLTASRRAPTFGPLKKGKIAQTHERLDCDLRLATGIFFLVDVDYNIVDHL
jgi:hypothetical protein